MTNRPSKLPRVCAAVVAAVCAVTGDAATARAAAAVSCTSLDGGGSRVSTANYTMDSSLGGLGGLLSVGADSLWGGYPAQLNNPPTVPPYVLDRGTNLSAKVLLTRLLSTVSDVDGDMVSFVGLAGSSTNGGAIGMLDGWVLYDPPAGNNNNEDGFTWIVQDAAGDQTVGSILVESVPPVPAYSLSLLAIIPNGGSSVTLKFVGVPGLTSIVQYADNLTPPIVWNTLGSATADGRGLFQIVDPTAGNAPQRYYRTLVQ